MASTSDSALQRRGAFSKSSINDMDRTTVSGENAVLGSAKRPQKGGDAQNSIGAENVCDPMNGGQPFHTAHLGKIPPEIREKIFINLLALPPPFAGPNIAEQCTGTSHKSAANGDNNPSNTSCYHLKESWLKTLQTRRQIYLEAFPVFYGRKSYYVASAEEFISLLKFGHPGAPGPLAFREDGITSLCIKGVVQHIIGTGCGGLEGTVTGICLDHTVISATSSLQGRKILRKISLCMRVGEEGLYLPFLFHLPGFEHGVIDFVDDSHVIIFPTHHSPFRYFLGAEKLLPIVRHVF